MAVEGELGHGPSHLLDADGGKDGAGELQGAAGAGGEDDAGSDAPDLQLVEVLICKTAELLFRLSLSIHSD